MMATKESPHGNKAFKLPVFEWGSRHSSRDRIRWENNFFVGSKSWAILWAYIRAPKVQMCNSYVSDILFKKSVAPGRNFVWYHWLCPPNNLKWWTSGMSTGTSSFVVWMTVWSRSTRRTNFLSCNNLSSSCLPSCSALSAEIFSSGTEWIMEMEADSRMTWWSSFFSFLKSCPHSTHKSFMTASWLHWEVEGFPGCIRSDLNRLEEVFPEEDVEVPPLLSILSPIPSSSIPCLLFQWLLEYFSREWHSVDGVKWQASDVICQLIRSPDKLSSNFNEDGHQNEPFFRIRFQQTPKTTFLPLFLIGTLNVTSQN